jgi:hypothetical protein
VLAARQVYEVNPYARLTIYAEGLTAENLDGFLGGDAPLHAVVDACDDLHARLLLRERARERGIPVLSEAGDRGMRSTPSATTWRAAGRPSTAASATCARTTCGRWTTTRGWGWSSPSWAPTRCRSAPARR